MARVFRCNYQDFVLLIPCSTHVQYGKACPSTVFEFVAQFIEARKLESKMSNLYHSWVSKLPVARDGMVYDPCVVQNVGRFQGMAASSIINTVSSLLCPPQLILRIFKIYFHRYLSGG